MRDALRTFARACALILGLGLAAPTLAQAPPPKAAVTILISIDGFRADYVYRGLTPNIAALAADGARASAMHPSYPSITFPNHYTLVTGLRPDRSGIVDNNMEDPAKPGVVFGMGKPAAFDPFWWDEAEPLWVTAEAAGVRTATMFWPGSDLPIHGRQASDWKLYDKTFGAKARVDQVLAWLKRPEAERPRFVTLYFDEVDELGHSAGPDSEGLNKALGRTDDAIGRLVAGLKTLGLYDQADLVLVSDHGMASTSPDRVTYIDDVLPAGSYRSITYGPSMGIAPQPGHEAEVATALAGPFPNMTCWPKGEMPARFHYGTNPRVPPFVCLGKTGWEIVSHAGLKAHPIGKGAHGFDPEDPLMNALFVAHGPDFRHGATQPPFDNVDIYPMLAKLIGVAPRPNDGHLQDLAPSLAH